MCSAYRNRKGESLKLATVNLLQTLLGANMAQRVHEWEEQKSKNIMFRSPMNYLHWVKTISYLVAASWNGDFCLYLWAGEALSKLLLTMGCLKYKRLWSCYIADMSAAKNGHRETYNKFKEGNSSVAKSDTPSVSIGVEHAWEQLRKYMKVYAGLAWTSKNLNARQRFFMATPELFSLAKLFNDRFCSAGCKGRQHYDIFPQQSPARAQGEQQHYECDYQTWIFLCCCMGETLSTILLHMHIYHISIKMLIGSR